MSWLSIPGTKYDICDETLELRHRARPSRRVYQVQGLYKIYLANGSQRRFKPQYLLECAEKGIEPVPSETTPTKTANKRRPWSSISRPWVNERGQSETYNLVVVPHTPPPREAPLRPGALRHNLERPPHAGDRRRSGVGGNMKRQKLNAERVFEFMLDVYLTTKRGKAPIRDIIRRHNIGTNAAKALKELGMISGSQGGGSQWIVARPTERMAEAVLERVVEIQAIHKAASQQKAPTPMPLLDSANHVAEEDQVFEADAPKGEGLLVEINRKLDILFREFGIAA